MRVLVCGGRDYNNDDRVFAVLNNYDADHNFTLVIEGGADGADRAARRWADANRIQTRTFRAAWEEYGRNAGPIRNKRMLTEGKPDIVIAFPGGKGTRNMVEQARQRGIEIIEIQ